MLFFEQILKTNLVIWYKKFRKTNYRCYFALEESDTVAALKFGLKMDTKFGELSIIGFADGGFTKIDTKCYHSKSMRQKWEKEQLNYW
jgi:hypothetical protein